MTTPSRKSLRRAGPAVLLLCVTLALVTALATSSDSPTGGGEPSAQQAEPHSLLERRPNIVVIMVDDMRADELRFMPRTRRLLGKRGVTFANAFSPHPLCCPARASALTGRYTHNHGVYTVKPPYGFRSFDDRSTLATWLRDSGYATVYLGKYLNGYGWMREPGRRRGDSTRYVPPGWDRWLASLDGRSRDEPPAGDTYDFYDTTLSVDGRRLLRLTGRYQTDAYGELSERIVRRRSTDERPYFLHASYAAPHSGWPFEPDDPLPVGRSDGTLTDFKTTARPPRVRGRFDVRLDVAPGSLWRDPDFSDKPGYLGDRPPLNAAEHAALLELARQRAEALWVVDQAVARTVRAVEASGESEDTVVLFTSDNGFFLGEQRMRQGKIYPHEPSLRVPLLLRGPGIPAGERRRDPFMSLDLAPTLAALAGVRPGHRVDGVSLADVARTGDRGWTRGVLTETGPIKDSTRQRFLIGLRTPRHLYVDVATGERELYDLRRDPEQLHNLAGRPAYADLQRQLARALSRLQDCRGKACAKPLPAALR